MHSFERLAIVVSSAKKWSFANILMMDGGSSTMESKSSSSKSSSNYRSNYRPMKILGRGAFCKVELAIHILTGLKVAIKIIPRRSTHDFSAEKVRREFNIMRLFTHPHIVRLYEVIETRSKIYVVMELMGSGELFDYLTESGVLQEDEARHFFQQIISGVEHCHLKKVVHQDLKLENLLLDSNRNVKIADFRLSNFMRDGRFLKTSCRSSSNYAAPELISEQLYAGPEVDVWSCGVILYALLCGTLPFDDDNFPGLYKKIKRGKYRLPDNLSRGAKDLIARILVVNPVNRISIPEIRRHPWFQQHLPQYIAMRTTNTMFDLTNKINEEIVQEAVKIGFNMETVTGSLEKKLQNEATVTYFLLMDNHFQGNNSNLMIEQLHSSQDQLDHPGIYLRSSPTLTEGKWAIGFKARAPPHQTMTDVLKILEGLNVQWKQTGHYKMKCIWRPPFFTCSKSIHSNDHPSQIDHICSHELSITSRSTWGLTSPKAVKFEIQLYKVNEDLYLLDMQRIYGPPFNFLEICAAFDALVVA